MKNGIRMLFCGMIVASVRLFGERGAAARKIGAEITAELIEKEFDLPDDPKEALLKLARIFSDDVELRGDTLHVSNCQICVLDLILENFPNESKVFLSKAQKCPLNVIFNTLAERKGWDVRLKPEKSPVRDGLDPGNCVQRLVEV